MADQKKVTRLPRYSRFSWLNIGTLFFGLIFIYMVVYVATYLSTSRIPTYEVTEGSISGNYRYTALALKTETVIPADYSGYVTYYARNGARVFSDSTVCSVHEQKSAPENERTLEELNDRERNILKDMSSSFALGFSDSSFQTVYNFKADLTSLMLKTAQVGDVLPGGLVNYVKAPLSGFVVFAVDGMEDLTENDLNASLFQTNEYRVNNLRLNNDRFKASDPLFKLITGETWNLYFPLSDQLRTKLQEVTGIRFRFLRENTTFSAAFSIVTAADGSSYGKITLKNSLVRFVTDRYVEIELLMDSRRGLKIPSSAITDKTFYRIPEEYVIINPDNSGEITFLHESYRGNGESMVNYVTASVYARQDGGYLIDPSLIEEGDYIQMPNTTKKHKVTTKNLVTIQGVYNVNQGFAQFRQVTVNDENEEFCIVEPYNIYGLAAHDFIVLDASKVNSGQILTS